MNVLGLVLARGGSKRLPGKNLKPLGGHPLIAWTIFRARQAVTLDHVCVSSDDGEILRTARAYGAEALVRPAPLAADDAPSYPAILHALDAMGPFPYVCLLQPTSPLRWSLDIDWCVTACRDLSPVTGSLPAYVSVAFRKDVPNGAIYVGRTDWLRDSWWRYSRGLTPHLPFDHPGILRYEMPAERSIDINTADDFAEAERIVQELGA